MSLAEIEAQLHAMTAAEKLRLMEALWADLTRDEENLPAPAWHEELLRKREARVRAGEESFIDWETAKQELRDRFK